MRSTRRKVLAIGLDAAAPGFVRGLIESGDMPNLQRILAKGRWMRVESTAYIGSGSVWPTFITGADPTVHGVYGEWEWQPESMDFVRYHGNDLPPFWQDFEKQQLKVGILDLPFMPLVGLTHGFEISEWGPHDIVEGKTVFGPPAIQQVLETHAKHPAAFGTSVSGPDDYQNLQKMAAACVEGARLRGELARSLITYTDPDFCLIVFPETHRSGHYLWHTTNRDHDLYSKNGFANLKLTEPSLKNIYQEVDRQIGQIASTFPDDATIMVFSMHGMQPSRGVPTFLGSILMQAGFTRLTDWRHQAWTDRARTLIATVKRLLPSPVKKLYYAMVPATTAHMVARSTLLPHYDWNRTRAFALPTDQHGWIRINLIGREARGIVPLDEYERTSEALEKLVQQLTSVDGRPLVRKVTRTAKQAQHALTQRIPDLIIHWEDAVFRSPLKIKGMANVPENIGNKYVGQHSLEGFCVLGGDAGPETGDRIAATEMGAWITRLLTSE